MSGRLLRHAYEKLIAEDLEWLAKQPRSLERDHIAAVLRESTAYTYGNQKTLVIPVEAPVLANRMDAPGGPQCGCGRPSAHESGWCGTECEAKFGDTVWVVRNAGPLPGSTCTCTDGGPDDACPFHGE